MEDFEVDVEELKYSEKKVLETLKQTIMLQKEKVDSLTIYDENYQKEFKLLIEMEDEYRRMKPKPDWKFILTYGLDAVKTLGFIGLGIGSMVMSYKTAELSWTSSEEMKLCDSRVYNLKDKFDDATKWSSRYPK
jgi:hypothetical protein